MWRVPGWLLCADSCVWGACACGAPRRRHVARRRLHCTSPARRGIQTPVPAAVTPTLHKRQTAAAGWRRPAPPPGNCTTEEDNHLRGPESRSVRNRRRPWQRRRPRKAAPQRESTGPATSPLGVRSGGVLSAVPADAYREICLRIWRVRVRVWCDAGVAAANARRHAARSDARRKRTDAAGVGECRATALNLV